MNKSCNSCTNQIYGKGTCGHHLNKLCVNPIMKDHKLAGKMWKGEPTTSHKIALYICSGSETCMRPCYEKYPHTIIPHQYLRTCGHTDHTDEKFHDYKIIPYTGEVSNINAV